MNEVAVVVHPLLGVVDVVKKPFPKVGDILTIKHQVKRTASGDVLGLQRADGKGYSARITAVFMDGQVRTGHSDIWMCKPGTQGHWETVNPSHV